MLRAIRPMPAALLLVLSLPAPTRAQAPDRVAAAVDANVAKQVADHRAGAAALVVVLGDRIVLARGYGNANPGVPVEPGTTLFRIASVSKVFVAAAAVDLALEGRLKLDADIATYVPDASIRNPFHRPVTTADLLTHTAGLGSSLQHALGATPADLLPLRTFFSRYPIDVVGVPGSGFAYSNVGMALAGTVVEAVSGRPFDAYLQDRMLAPLGMRRSSFTQPLPPDLAGDLAGSKSPRQPPFIVPYPAGSLAATVTDMGRFLIAQLNHGAVDGRQVFSPDAVAMLQGRHWGDSRVQGVAFGFFESWMRGERALFHTGDSGHHGLLWMLPARRVGLYVVYATGDAGALELREEVARAALDALGAAEETRVEHPRAEDLARYAGDYAMNGVPLRSVEHAIGLVGQVQIRVAPSGDRLLITPPGRGARVPATGIGRALFRMDDGGTLAFLPEPAGAAMGFTLTGSIWDPQGFHRVGWVDGQPLAIVIVVAGVCALLGRVCLTAWDLIGRRRRRLAVRAPWAWRLSGWLPFLLLLVPVIAVAGMLQSPPPYVRVPGGIRAALWLLTGLSAACLMLPLLGVASFRNPAWRPGRRWFFVAFSVALAAVGWLLFYWGLADPRAGV